uniref:Uncharacterized protein n=1 Tax=Sphaerodactylus townsendi TaxID=933632 RepID=A0ACB8F0V3_9SAUR
MARPARPPAPPGTRDSAVPPDGEAGSSSRRGWGGSAAAAAGTPRPRPRTGSRGAERRASRSNGGRDSAHGRRGRGDPRPPPRGAPIGPTRPSWSRRAAGSCAGPASPGRGAGRQPAAGDGPGMPVGAGRRAWREGFSGLELGGEGIKGEEGRHLGEWWEWRTEKEPVDGRLEGKQRGVEKGRQEIVNEEGRSQEGEAAGGQEKGEEGRREKCVAGGWEKGALWREQAPSCPD